MLFGVDPIYLHYMTDRQERFDLKISKLKIWILWKHMENMETKTPKSWMPLR